LKAGPFRLEAFESLGSTNDEAMDRLRAGDPGGLFITAVEQTGGRGRQGRSWSSPPGNLYASLALRDPAPLASVPQLGFVAGVALAGTLRARLGGDGRLQLKWPNDVLFAGAKLAGILLECTTLPDGQVGCVIGFGVNCAWHPETLAYPATDLRAAGDPSAEPSAVLAGLADALATELSGWDRGGGFAALRSRWLALAAGLGAPISVTTPSRTLSGVFRDLDPLGRLVIDMPGGSATIDSGDVLLGRPGSAAPSIGTETDQGRGERQKVECE
jgi:BirA family transcriptional regulator, biotin operon repressor / biotin---[acetyl-CoA-carboxylase] ligase